MRLKTISMGYLTIICILTLIISGCSEVPSTSIEVPKPVEIVTYQVTTFPETISKTCREGIANIYDECGSQHQILDDAIQAAREADKRVLILYGAEWCIWCHVFDNYVKGVSRRFKYQWQYHDGDNLKWTMYEKANKKAEQEARVLNQYFAENFVLAHIESYYSPDGEQVLVDLGYDVDSIVGVPVILVLNTAGEIATEMKSSKELIGLELREDSGEEFRGYDRNLLLTEIKSMRVAAE